METARKMRSQGYRGEIIFITILKEMVFDSFEVEEGQKIYALLFLFPILLILLVSEYIGSELSSSTVIIESGRTVNATDHCPLLFLQVLGTASLLGILYGYHKLQERFRLQKEMCLLKQESHFQQQYVEEAKLWSANRYRYG